MGLTRPIMAILIGCRLTAAPVWSMTINGSSFDIGGDFVLRSIAIARLTQALPAGVWARLDLRERIGLERGERPLAGCDIDHE